jgi:hypothetical protein
VVRGFRLASLKGWDYALQHPDEIAGRLVATLPRPPGITDAAGFARYQTDVARRLTRYADIPLGHSNPDRWNRIEASLLGVGALLRTVDADEFLYDPDAEARSRTDLRAFALLGATLLGGLVVLALLWLRWNRRPAPAAVSTGAPSAPPRQRVRARPVAPASPEPVAADLNTMLTRLERAIRQRLPRGVDYRASLLSGLWQCRADPKTVSGLVLGLVAEAGAGGGRLILGTRNAAFDDGSVTDTPGAEIGEFVRVTIRDGGPGLSDEALDQVLDPALTTRPGAAGAAETMRRLGGFIRVESAEGVGTAVHLYFPRLAEAAATAATDDKPAAAAE